MVNYYLNILLSILFVVQQNLFCFSCMKYWWFSNKKNCIAELDLQYNNAAINVKPERGDH